MQRSQQVVAATSAYAHCPLTQEIKRRPGKGLLTEGTATPAGLGNDRIEKKNDKLCRERDHNRGPYLNIIQKLSNAP